MTACSWVVALIWKEAGFWSTISVLIPQVFFLQIIITTSWNVSNRSNITLGIFHIDFFCLNNFV